MTLRTRSYEGTNLTVDYDVKRCIHAEECAHGLPEVFDPARRPWVDPDRASAEDLVRVIERCPTGALQYRRHDGGENEKPPTTTSIVRVGADGPLYFKGRLRIALPEVLMLDETRAALCRCGQSQDKPFCDGSHVEAGFIDDGTVAENRLASGERGEADVLEISPAPNGPLLIRGPVEIRGSEGAIVEGAAGALCRCGGSSTKPFCDGAHKTIGFQTD